MVIPEPVEFRVKFRITIIIIRGQGVSIGDTPRKALGGEAYQLTSHPASYLHVVVL